MSVNSIISSLNKNKTKVKSKRVICLKSYYLSMYRVYMMRLFDKCYISDPTVFNEREIYKNIAEMSIVDVFSYSGSISLDYNHLKFAYLKETGNAKEFLELLMNAVKYRELCLYLDRVYEDFNFRGSNAARIKLNLCSQGAKVLAMSGVEFNEATAECFTEFQREVKVLSINEYIWCLAMQELGIPKEDWLLDGLFDSKLSHSEEVECAEGILNGVFKVTGGRYSNVLLKWLKEHPWGTNRVTVEAKGLFDYTLHFKDYEINSVVDAIVEAIDKDKDYELVGMYGSNIYYSQTRESLKMPIGSFQIINMCNDEEILNNESLNIIGLTGEFYSVDRLEEDEFAYAGCPILIPVGDEIITVYDREQTDVQFESWYSYNSADVTFDDGTSYPKSPFRSGSLSEELYTGYVNSSKSSDNLITTLHVSSQSQLEQSIKDVKKFIEGLQNET